MDTTLTSAAEREAPLQTTEPSAAGSYFVSAYPPFAAWEPSQVGAVKALLGRPRPARALGLYVHIPFCEKKCDYCYYLSFAGRSQSAVLAYLEAVLGELRIYASTPAVKGREVAFVYFGGGTPSLLTPNQIRFLVSGLQDVLPWDSVREVTFECAPRSVRPETVEALRDLGVTRVSLGVQSFDDDLLRQNGRIHLVEDVLRAHRLLRDAGIDWINVDLIVGLPGETWEKWRDSVRSAMFLEPDSVTMYQAEMPHSSKAYRDYKDSRAVAPPISWSVKRDRLGYAFEELEDAGYSVASAYAAVKDPSRHRFVYQEELWTGSDMLGLGLASFSYLGGAHFQNVKSLDTYESLVRGGTPPIGRARVLTHEEEVVRELVLQLKLGGVERRYFLEKFRVDVLERFSEPIAEMENEGWLVASEAGVTLTRRGLLRVDALLPRFYLKEHQGVRRT